MAKIIYSSNGLKIDDEFISIDDVKKKCMSAHIEEHDYVLVKIAWAETRNCDCIYENLIMCRLEAERYKKMIVGRVVYFGEINGKYSEVYGEVESDEFEIIYDNKIVSSFYLTYPKGVECNHSFYDKFSGDVENGVYEDLKVEYFNWEIDMPNVDTKD